MNVDICLSDISDIIKCDNCGLILSTDICKKKYKDRCDVPEGKCPLCKHKVYDYNERW